MRFTWNTKLQDAGWSASGGGSEMLPSRDLCPDLAMARPSQERVEVKAGRVPVRLRHQAGPHTIATLFCFLFAGPK